MQIYLARHNVQAGPYSLDQLNTMLASGEVLLEDLAWHEGLSQWQRLGDLTNNQYAYHPSVSSPAQGPFGNSANQNGYSAAGSNTQGYSELEPGQGHNGQETSQGQNTGERRVTVDQLYGNRPNSSSGSGLNDTANSRSPQADPHSNAKPTFSRAPIAKRSTQSHQGTQPTVLASIPSRALALIINALLYLMAILPVLIALTKIDVDLETLANMQDMQAAYAYSAQLMAQIPSTTMWASQLMMFGLFAIQLILISRRGQSLGKMMTGIRVVDKTTHRLPSWGKLVGMRTLLLFLIYNLAFSLNSFAGFALIIVHFVMAMTNPEKMGWHDRLANTQVVKADPKQLEKDR